MGNSEILKTLKESYICREKTMTILKTLLYSRIISRDVYNELNSNISGIIADTGGANLYELAFENHQYVFECNVEGSYKKFLIKVTAEEIK